MNGGWFEGGEGDDEFEKSRKEKAKQDEYERMTLQATDAQRKLDQYMANHEAHPRPMVAIIADTVGIQNHGGEDLNTKYWKRMEEERRKEELKKELAYRERMR